MTHDPRSRDRRSWWVSLWLDLLVLAVVLGLSYLGAPGWLVLVVALVGMWLAGRAARALGPPR